MDLLLYSSLESMAWVLAASSWSMSSDSMVGESAGCVVGDGRGVDEWCNAGKGGEEEGRVRLSACLTALRSVPFLSLACVSDHFDTPWLRDAFMSFRATDRLPTNVRVSPQLSYSQPGRNSKKNQKGKRTQGPTPKSQCGCVLSRPRRGAVPRAHPFSFSIFFFPSSIRYTPPPPSLLLLRRQIFHP